MDAVREEVGAVGREIAVLAPVSGCSGPEVACDNRAGDQITRVAGNIPVDLPVQMGDRFLFISFDQSALTHGLHKYPAKFFPELPRWLIQRYSREGDVVLDPFAGSGTTNVEARLLGRHSVAVDVDPFSRFLASVKVTPLDEAELTQCKHVLLRAVAEYDPASVSESDVPSFPYRDNWFRSEITSELAYVRRSIDGMEAGGASEAARDFFRVCLSSTIRAVSNADNNCTRTVIRKRLNKQISPGFALHRFSAAVIANVPKMIEFSRLCPRNVRVELPTDSDARDIRYSDGSFDLAVTSPPYANAVDYPRTHQLEMYWLGLASGSLTPLKRRHVGTEAVKVAEYGKLGRIGVAEADDCLGRIFALDPRRAFIAYKYLADMRRNLAEVHRVLRPGGRYVVVLGNNRIRGQVFESWKYVMTMAGDLGFRVECYFGSEIINHFIKVPREERINTDWVLVLRKPAR